MSGISKNSAHLLKIYFSNQYAYAQVMRMPGGHIVASASSIEKVRGRGQQHACVGSSPVFTSESSKRQRRWGTACGIWSLGQQDRLMAHWLQDLRTSMTSRANVAASQLVGQRLGERVVAAGVSSVHWDRKVGQRCHGRIKAVLEALQAHGVKLA